MRAHVPAPPTGSAASRSDAHCPGRQGGKGGSEGGQELDIGPSFLGNGSNLLVPDEGYGGFVVKLCGLDPRPGK